MQEKTLKILVAVLRVFVGSADRGNTITLHENEIINQVCRGMHKRKEKEIKNMRGMIVFAVRALKGGRILYEAFDSWSDDKLNRPKSISEKKLFGLTDIALKYIEEHMIVGVNTQSNQFLIDMLQSDEFKILPKQPPQITVDSAPAALVETVNAIKQEQKQELMAMPAQNTNEPKQSASHNVQRLITTVRNRTAGWGSQSTPADLLGGLYEYYLANEGENANSASMIKLGWPEHRRRVYRLAMAFLKSHGLVEDLSMRRTPGTNKLRPYGIKLTDLGLEVADAGDFKDLRPPSERSNVTANDVTTGSRKKNPMLKGQKKPVVETNDTEDAPTSPRQIELMMAQLQEMREENRKMHEEIRALRDARAEVEAESDDNETDYYTYHRQMPTMKILLSTAVTGMVESFAALLDAEHNCINSDGAYLALTELEKVILGFKAYISECLKNNKLVDIELIRAYAEDYKKAIAKSLETDRAAPVPIMGEKIETKRSLVGDAAINRQTWKRPASARA